MTKLTTQKLTFIISESKATFPLLSSKQQSGDEVADRLALPPVGDNATWHVSKQVRQWLKAHNAQVKRFGVGVRLIVCRLPVKSPWLNAIEPKWMHAKRAVIELHQTLSAQELKTRICDHFGSTLLASLAKQVA